MNTLPNTPTMPLCLSKQRGVVLFFALIALLAMSLAAVALIRSVDTGTLIAGNISFRRAATTSADTGTETAMAWLNTTAQAPFNVLMDPNHPLNQNAPAAGYYSNMNPALSLTDGTGIPWTNADSMLVGTDATGNQVRYVIQRMCSTVNTPIANNSCLFSGQIVDDNQKNIPLPQDICNGPGCPLPGQTVLYRITTRTSGPRLTLSYTQAFVY